MNKKFKFTGAHFRRYGIGGTIAGSKGKKVSIVASRPTQSLEKSPNILDELIRALNSAGLVGEDRNAKLMYLAITSRLLDRPVSLVVTGSPASGKSQLVKKVLRFFPDMAFITITAQSPLTLAYFKEDISHRMLVYYEMAGLHGDKQTYFIRTLLSEDVIEYDKVNSSADGTHRLKTQGPVGLICTTTETKLHADLATRVLQVTADESAEQTKKIMMSYTKAKPENDTMYSVWHDLQDTLRKNAAGVCVPYARDLAGLMPEAPVRLRRDFLVALKLIEAHAMLHAANRKRSSQGRVVAKLVDFIEIAKLLEPVLSQCIVAEIDPLVRQTISCVTALREGKKQVTNDELAKGLNVDKSNASRRAAAAVKAGYLRNRQTKPRMPSDYVLAARIPKKVFPTPVELNRAWKVRRSSESANLAASGQLKNS